MLNTQKHTTLFSLGLQPGIKPVFFIFLIFFQVFCVKSQENLVPNGSFEEYWECPTAPGSLGDNQLERCKYWCKPNLATSDYYNSCQINVNLGVSVPNNWFGHQKPFDGNGYVGLAIYLPTNETASEYIQVKLTKPLQPCIVYEIRFWVSLADFSAITTNSIGARLDFYPINNSNFDAFNSSPHINSFDFVTDTSEWTLISGLYLASGGEEYLTIGRFLDSTVSLNNIPNYSVQCNNCFQPENAYYYVDSVSIKKKNNEIFISMPNVFTANDDYLNDYWYPHEICFNDWQCSIINRWGEIVFKFSSSENGWDGKDSKGNELIEGVYFYIIENKEIKQTGYIHLIR